MLENRVIVITGGAGLLGRAFVKSIVENGGTAIIADINKDVGETVKIELSNILDTNQIDFIEMDITSKKSLLNCISALYVRFGKIDALVNNAYPKNKGYGNHFFDVDFADFTENLSSNLGGYFLTSQQFSSFFKKQGYGNIVNISSIYGVVPPRFEVYDDTDMTMPVEYAVIKSGLIHLTKYMAKYLKGSNIRVNSISPGGIWNKQQDKFVRSYNKFGLNKGVLDKHDMNGTLVFLLSNNSTYINGQNIIVDDGWTL